MLLLRLFSFCFDLLLPLPLVESRKRNLALVACCVCSVLFYRPSLYRIIIAIEWWVESTSSLLNQVRGILPYLEKKCGPWPSVVLPVSSFHQERSKLIPALGTFLEIRRVSSDLLPAFRVPATKDRILPFPSEESLVAGNGDFVTGKLC
jgi:hypothetical protein